MIKKHNKTSMQQHADEISNLVLLGYAELENAQQRHLAVESFENSPENPQLQRHLLAIAPPDLPTAVWACMEYLNIKLTGTGNVRQLGEDEAEDVRGLSSKDRDTLDNLAKMVQERSQSVASPQKENLERRRNRRTGKKTGDKKNNLTCWGCQKEGHQRKDRRTHPWPKTETKEAQQGNGTSPHQQ